MSKKIKNKHILIAGSAPSLKKHWDKIEKFIKENNIITIGGNHVSNIFAPDYHFWGCDRRWKKYGNLVHKDSVLIFPPTEREKVIRKHWSGYYEKYDTKKRPNKSYKNMKSIYHCFKNIVMVAIFWAYNKGVKKISIVGMDGYTLYSKKDLNDKKSSQHCYGKGNTDGFTYEYCRKKDIAYYERLKHLYKYGEKKHGFGFEIITPTIYKRFYNPNILKIKETYNVKEPSMLEKKKLKNAEKNRKIDSKY